jgi:hypothetical protein
MNNSDYEKLLKDLEEQRAKREQEFKIEMEGLDEAISGLKKILGNQQPVAPQPQAAVVTTPEGSYAGMSVRWGILNLLGEHSNGALPTARIADALKTGGITSSGQNFNSNVSAVISDMTNKRLELESTESGYRLTDNGKSAWAAIKRTPQYVNRLSVTAG